MKQTEDILTQHMSPTDIEAAKFIEDRSETLKGMQENFDKETEIADLEKRLNSLKREYGEKSHHQALAGQKFDDKKPHCHQVLGLFARALIRVSEHGTEGNKKYTSGGWLKVPEANTRYRDAMMRHQLAEASGEELDEDGYDHLTAIAWNALAILELRERKKEESRTGPSDGYP